MSALETDDLVRLPAVQALFSFNEEGEPRALVWCDTCKWWHIHGADPGWREGTASMTRVRHCYAQPPKYWLAYAGDINWDEAWCRVEDARPKASTDHGRDFYEIFDPHVVELFEPGTAQATTAGAPLYVGPLFRHYIGIDDSPHVFYRQGHERSLFVIEQLSEEALLALTGPSYWTRIFGEAWATPDGLRRIADCLWGCYPSAYWDLPARCYDSRKPHEGMPGNPFEDGKTFADIAVQLPTTSSEQFPALCLDTTTSRFDLPTGTGPEPTPLPMLPLRDHCAENQLARVGDRAPESASRLVLDPREPLKTARLFVERHYRMDGLRTLLHHAGTYYEWTGVCFVAMDEQLIRKAIYEFLDGALCSSHQATVPLPFQANTSRVNNVLDALATVCHVSPKLVPPAWLNEAPENYPPILESVVCQNGVLDLASGRLFPPTPALFAVNVIGCPFDPSAPPPTAWFEFLDDLWGDDSDAISRLQEMFGYLLTPNTSQQKMFLFVGPKRSGKGTLARVLTAILGVQNVCGPTLSGLSTNFGMAALIGKTVAIVADARLGGRADQQVIAERLLSLSGEDTLTIDRKYLPPWTGRLSTRLLIMTNELPRIGDVSGALPSRFIVLTLRRSFYGQENPGLIGRLVAELPGILNWAVDGWRRLHARGHFVQPASSAEAIRELEDLGSPVGAFVRERCELGVGFEVACGDVYEEWKNWCQIQGRDHPGTVQSFGRDLRAAVPGLSTTQPNEASGDRRRRYTGIHLKRASTG
jgi:putative DNA primase/helicase